MVPPAHKQAYIYKDLTKKSFGKFLIEKIWAIFILCRQLLKLHKVKPCVASGNNRSEWNKMECMYPWRVRGRKTVKFETLGTTNSIKPIIRPKGQEKTEKSYMKYMKSFKSTIPQNWISKHGFVQSWLYGVLKRVDSEIWDKYWAIFETNTI